MGECESVQARRSLMRQLINLVFVPFLSHVWCESQGVVTPSCCPQVFLSSGGPLASKSPDTLGIYTVSNQRLANNPRPIYLKQIAGKDFYLYYRTSKDEDKGWTVSSELLGAEQLVSTSVQGANCPAGIFGGFLGDGLERDNSFSIECHSDVVKVACCDSLEVKGTLGGISGKYVRNGDVNGHPSYAGGQSNSTGLYYKKAGYGEDGWAFGDQSHVAKVTTGEKGPCPDLVTRGTMGTSSDPSLMIVCRVEESRVQDPGVPVAPLAKKATMSTSAKESISNSIFLRLVILIYLSIENRP